MRYQFILIRILISLCEEVGGSDDDDMGEIDVPGAINLSASAEAMVFAQLSKKRLWFS